MTRISSLVFVLFISVVSACVTSSDDGDRDDGRDGTGGGDGSGSGTGSDGGSNGDGSGDGSDGGGGNTSVVPKVGGWFYDETTPVSSNCPQGTPITNAGGFLIDQASSTSFHVIPEDSTQPFTCTLDGSNFACPDRATYIEDYRPGFDAVVTVHATASGTFSSSTAATGRQMATASCEGTQCPAGLPCNAVVDFEIRAN